jgi:hypothetical protein
MGHLQRLATLSALAVATAVSTPGLADDNEAAARAIFEQASRDMDAGAYEKACPALVEVVKLTRGIGSMIKLGKCYEAQGKLASAWAIFKEAAEAARLAHDTREVAADAKAQELFPKLPRLSVTVSAEVAGVPGLSIKWDDVPLVRAQWNTDVPVDAGKHALVVSAPGKKTWMSTVDASAVGGATTVAVPALVDEPPPPVTPPPPRVEAAIAPAPPPPASRAWAWAVGAGGVVALGVGAAFGVGVGIEEGKFHSMCPGGTCPAGSQTTVNGYVHARDTDAVLLGVLGGVGVVGISIGSYGLLHARSGSAQAGLVLLPGGMRVEGVFW